MAIVTSRICDYNLYLVDHPELLQVAKEGLAAGKAVWRVQGIATTVVLKPEKPRKGKKYPAIMALPDGTTQRGQWNDWGLTLQQGRDENGNSVWYSVDGKRVVYDNPVKR